MKGSPIVVLDIGTSKVLCLVGELQADEKLRILGVGSSPCSGFRRSGILDMAKVVQSIKTATSNAERSAGLKITGAYVGLAGEDISAHTSHSTVAISGMANPIDEDDVRRALSAAEQSVPPSSNSSVLHRFVQSYAVDGELVQNPLWLHGNRLEIETLSISAAGAACNTLHRAAAEAGIEIVGFIYETVAAASSVVSLDEREMGVGILDIGAGTSDLSLFYGPLRHVAQIPFGGDDITKDLSIVLSTSHREVERLKKENGSVCCPVDDADETLSFNTTAGREYTLTQHQLSAIIEARQQDILEFVRRELESNRYGQLLAAGLLFTGGGALLNNITQLAEEILGMPVRIGVPQNIVSSDALEDPTYATAIGLLRFAMDDHSQEADYISPFSEGETLRDKISKLFSFL